MIVCAAHTTVAIERLVALQRNYIKGGEKARSDVPLEVEGQAHVFVGHDGEGGVVVPVRSVGIDATATADRLVVLGGDSVPGGHVETAGDHRLAMAFSVLDKFAEGKVSLSETDSPVVSYPGFFEDLEKATE